MKNSNFVLLGAFIIISAISPLYAADGLSDFFGGVVDSVKNAVETVGKQTGETKPQLDNDERTASDGFKYKVIDWPDGIYYKVAWNKKLNKYACPGTSENFAWAENRTEDGQWVSSNVIQEDEAIGRKIPSVTGKNCHGTRETSNAVKASKTTQISTGKYKEIDLIDLKVEIASLNGKKISVVGVVSSVGDPFTFIGTNKLDESKVVILIDKLSKEDRKSLFTKCNEGCDLRVNGTVRVRQGAGDVQAEQISVF